MGENNASDSVRHQIRSAVAETHGVLDNFVVSQEPFSSREAYGSFLWRMRQLYVAFQPAIAAVSQKICLPDCSPSCIAAATQDNPSMPSPACPPKLNHLDEGAWGYAYVMEGSALGATQLLKLANQKLPAGSSVNFLNTVSSHAKTRWPTFITEIDRRCENVESAIVAAEHAFSYALEIFANPISIADRSKL